MAALVAPPAPAVSPPPSQGGWAMVVDGKNLLRLWLEEKIARHEMTPAESDKMLDEQEGKGKLWAGPVKDGRGYLDLLQKIGKDFGTWKNAKVTFTKSKAGHDLVIFKGKAALRKFTKGTRYRVDNVKMVEMQIGKPGIKAAARESARFGIYLVVAVDVADYFMRDDATLGQLLGNLTVDISSVMLASAIGAAAGSLVTSSAVGMAVVGGLACGPFLVAFAVGVLCGIVLYKIDEYFHIHQKLAELYDKGLAKLAEVWEKLGAEAQARFNQLAHSRIVHDMRQDAKMLAAKLARQADVIRGELSYL